MGAFHQPEGRRRVPVFITLEGIDRAGKTTQLQLLTEYLQAQGRDFVVTREPGGTPLGEELRRILLAPGRQMTLFTEAFLFAAARAELVAQVIRPALQQGRSVVSDRYVDSSVAYQAYGRGLPPEFVIAINQMATGDLRPHRTILLDIPVEEAARRQGAGEGDRLGSLDLEFFQRVREGYLELAAAEPRRFRVVDATRPVHEVQAEIRRLVDEIWPGRRPGPRQGGDVR